MPDPPLARSLYASVEVGQGIPEEFFHAVAQVLAFVYRTAEPQEAARMTQALKKVIEVHRPHGGRRWSCWSS